MTLFQSSQNFIRALKASSDPPNPGGLCKIDIARQAWDNNSFYLPSKAEIIAEWILSTLSKEKSRSDSVCNPQYWKLLLDILSDKSSSNVRPLKTWLSPLLHRISIQPILSSILGMYHRIDSPEEVIDYVSSCISIMWPISVQKMTLENLTDLLGLLLQKANEGELRPGIINIGMLVTSSYRASLGNSVNKKKFYQLFLQAFFSDWLRILARNPSSPTDLPLAHSQFLQNVYEAGTDTLFNLDILRHFSANHSTDHSATLFGHFHTANSEASYMLLVMPRLFLSYVQALKRHRGAVFNQGSHVDVAALTDELNAASMKFFANCEAVLTGWSDDDNAVSRGDIWRTRLGLLETVLDEKLFSIQQDDAAAVLNKIIEDAIEVLSGSWKSEHNVTISPTVKCLHKIGQIDCDLLLPSLSRILPFLLPMAVTDSAPMSFLDLILDYHTKTRTLNTHLTNLLSSFIPTSFPPSEIVDRREVYELCFSGHVLGNQHLAKLGTMIQSFLTPGQTQKLVEKLVEVLKFSWKTFFDVGEGEVGDAGSPKKRKKENNPEKEHAVGVDGALESMGHDVESLAVSFSLQVHLALIIFSNLPVQHLTEDSATTIRGIITEFRENLVRRALVTLLRTKWLIGSEKKKRGRELLTMSSGWAFQVVAAALLRLNYALGVARELVLDSEPESKVIGRAKGIIAKIGGEGNLIAELELEIFRTLLFHISGHHVHQDEVVEILDSVFSYLNESFKSSDRGWSGLACHLKSPESGALALFHLILEQWLPYVDNLASPSQLTNLVQLILGIDLSANSISTDVNLRPEHLLLRILHSAEFWEMHNIQSAFLPHLVEITDHVNAPFGENESAVYHLLLYVPAEYYNRATRIHFVRRALAADIQLVQDFHHGEDKEEEEQQRKSLLRKLITLRVFLKRVIELVGFERTPDVDLGDFVIHLITFDCPLEGREYDVFAQVTLELSELYFSELAKDSVSNSSIMLKIISSFSQYSALVSAKNEPQKLQFKAITSLLDAITRLNSSNFPSQCMAAMQSLHADLSKAFSSQLQGMQQLPITHYLETLVGWCCVLTLRKWLGESSSGEGDDSSGKRLMSLIVREHGDEEKLDDIRNSIFAILRAELALVSDLLARQSKLNLILASFILFYGASRTSTQAKLDKHISLISQSLAPADYLHGLNLLSDWLSSNSFSTRERETIIHLSILLLRNHPQNALKHMQTFTTQCLNTFAGYREFIHSTIEFRLLILEFVVQHCSERPAALRSVDIGNIWIILFRFLEPSEEHDEVTTLDIFYKVVATISALVRLRRDLVTPVLPHLGLVLRQLLSLIRSCRPQLGTKQTSMVMQTLPRWVNVKQPLGGEAARVLSRLLETLNTKTIIRSHTAIDTQKPESLAKPFSKHAAYVLAAYIEAMNDPLCVVTLEMRRELEPGLFTLCGFMGEHARDALVVALDANSKALLKLIWREYEKQRYAGEG